MVLFGRFLSALREGHGRPVRLAARGERGELLAGLGAVDEALDFDALPMEEVFAARPASECALPRRLGRCDLLVSCFAAGDGRAERRLGELCSAGRALFLPTRPPRDFRGHLLDLWARAAGVDPLPAPQWTVPEAWRDGARRALAQVGADADAPYVVIHPGSGSREKCWPLERFVALARAVSSRRGRRRCIFLLGPTELDWWGGATLAPLRSEYATIVSPPLGVVAALSAGAAAYVGNDSGPTHLAAALGTPTVAIFGPTDPVQFAPRGRSVRVIHAARLEDISAPDVLAALDGLAPLPGAGKRSGGAKAGRADHPGR